VVFALVLTACGSAQDVANSPPAQTSASSESATGAPTAPSSDPTSSEPPASDGSTAPGNLPAGFGAGPPGSGLRRFYDQHVDWTDCGGGDTCASIWVPLDYDDPNGRAITIHAKLDPADDPSHKVGTLFINPGGPGVSGIGYLDYAGFDKPITDAYDIVGFDPRGVASSTPVDCISDSELKTYVASDPTPDTPAEVTEFENSWSQFTAGCVARSGPLLQHVSTVEVARDMDVLRALVGDKKLNYFGASYGTFIGANYAALFPKNVGRMVLDGAIDPLSTPRENDLNQAVGFETALTAYLTYCVDQGDCPLGDDVDSARQAVANLFSSLDANPLPTSDGHVLTEGLGFYGVILPLYSRNSWTYLTLAFKQAVQGDGSLLYALANQYPFDAVEAQAAVDCLDDPEHESVAQIEAGEAQFDKAAPVFGPAAAWFPYGCSNWPVKRIQPQPDFSAKGAAPIVVVGTTRDPATPYEQAVALARELDSGVLLSRDGDGHTAYASGNSCIDSAVDAYLAQGIVPPNDTMC
jgi:pimeloyl-ACP methyl ester carboxylesterase